MNISDSGRAETGAVDNLHFNKIIPQLSDLGEGGEEGSGQDRFYINTLKKDATVAPVGNDFYAVGRVVGENVLVTPSGESRVSIGEIDENASLRVILQDRACVFLGSGDPYNIKVRINGPDALLVCRRKTVLPLRFDYQDGASSDQIYFIDEDKIPTIDDFKRGITTVDAVNDKGETIRVSFAIAKLTLTPDEQGETYSDEVVVFQGIT